VPAHVALGAVELGPLRVWVESRPA
jgi:hypothetical protein